MWIVTFKSDTVSFFCSEKCFSNFEKAYSEFNKSQKVRNGDYSELKCGVCSNIPSIRLESDIVDDVYEPSIKHVHRSEWINLDGKTYYKRTYGLCNNCVHSNNS